MRRAASKPGLAAEILVTVFILMIAAALILPGLRLMKDRGNRGAACLSNLKQIMLGIKTYTPDYNEWYPTSAAPDQSIDVQNHYRDLGILYPHYVSALDVFTCPDSADRLPHVRVTTTEDDRPFGRDEARQVSYAYSYNGSGAKKTPWMEESPSKTRVLADRHAGRALRRDSNHILEGRHVAFADGHVKWISGRAKLPTNPDHPDSRIRKACWWSER